MSKILYKNRWDWADEFDVYCFELVEKEQFEKWRDLAKKFFDNGGYLSEVGFGTNEALDFGIFDEIFNDGSFFEISDEEAAVFTKYFYGYDGVKFGQISLSRIMQEIEDKISEDIIENER